MPFPKVSHEDYLRQTADDLLFLLEGRQSQLLPTLSYGSPTRNAFLDIARLLKRATAIHDPPPCRPPTPPAQPPVPVPQPVPLLTPFSEPPYSPRPFLPSPVSPSLLPSPVSPSLPPMPPLPPPPPTPTPLRRPIATPRNLASVYPRPISPVVPPRVVPSSSPAVVPRVVTSPSPVVVPRVVASPSPVLPCPIPVVAPRRYPARKRTATCRYGFAANAIASTEDMAPYQNHIAALATDLALSVEKVKLPSLYKLLKGPDAAIWNTSNANEFGRLLPRGVGKSRPVEERIAGTGTFFPIRKRDIPQGRTATYGNFVCDIRPHKAETHRVRLTLGGNLLDFPGDPSSPAVSVTNAKLHINSTISDAKRGARYFTLDIKNFYLGSPLSYYQYVRIPVALLPAEILAEYDEICVENDGYAYFEV